MKVRIHVNKQVIGANNKHGRNDPPLSVKTYKENTKAHHVKCEGPVEIIHSPDKPLSCGARVWIETESAVYADGKLVNG